MRFQLSEELALFAESVRATIGDWEPSREPELGIWQEDRDDELAARLAATGWADLGVEPEVLGPAIAGGIELGRAIAPLCLVDGPTLGAPLWVDGRARHGSAAKTLAVPRSQGGLGLAAAVTKAIPEPTLDGSGTVRVKIGDVEELEPADAARRWSVWSAASLAYLAGLEARALELSVEHARSREQFGSPLAALPAVQSRLADCALAVDATMLLAWAHDADAPSLRAADLLWAANACCEVTASAIQIHGATGFALESGLHRPYRRARAASSWLEAVCAATR